MACAALALSWLPARAAEELEQVLGRLDIARFEVDGNTLLPPAEIAEVLAPFTGKNRGFADIKRAVAALQDAYHRRGLNLVQVGLPEQELDGGVVRLRVAEVRIGKVTVAGNQHFDADNIRASVPGLRPGESPNLARISASLRTANENPAKNTRLELKRDEATDAVDATLKVADEKPVSWGASLDNAGTQSTGKVRASATFQNANFLGLDHVLGLQYTTTLQKPDKVKVYGAGYHVPLYNEGDSVDLFASYSDVNSGTVAAGAFDLQVSGSGTTWGGRYNHNLGRFGDIESKLAYGFDYKAFRSNVLLQGVQLGNDITVHPLSLGYTATWSGPESEASFNAAVFHNVPGGDRGRAVDFQKARVGAPAEYTLLRYGAGYGRTFAGDWQLRLRLQGQVTSQSLVAGEQFGAGGAATVRGFSEREIANDQGRAASVELYTPQFLAGTDDGLQYRLLAFYDHAHVWRNNTLPGEQASASIASAGVGLRASLGKRASLQMDVGKVIDAGPIEQKGDINMHVRLSLSF